MPEQPDKEQLAEAGAFVGSLAAHGQIGTSGMGRPWRTHAIETDANGRQILVRKRFSAV